MTAAPRAFLAQRLPVYYGWVIFALVASTSYAARPLMSVSVLAVFVVPITETFGWSRGLLSGAVSVGGLCGVLISPVVGRVLDRYGSGAMISVASAIAGMCAIGLSYISQVWTFYALYVPGRMVFASPLELATTTALSNWFIRRRALMLALYGVTQGTGLTLMPLVAQWLITGWGWRQAWWTLGFYTLAIGVIPSVLLMARRPEDMGLASDPVAPRQRTERGPQGLLPSRAEVQFTLQQALRTRAFWVLATFAGTGFMAQAGISLHQVSHYIHRGLSASQAALMASTFALTQVPGGLLWSALTRRWPIRLVLALAGLAVALGATGIVLAAHPVAGAGASGLLGIGVSGLHLLLRLAWAEYYGRQHLGTIQGVTLPVQLAGQAMGPVLSGFLFDLTGAYNSAFLGLAGVVTLGSMLVLTAVPPGRPAETV
jgi:MFS family permease